MGKKDKSDDNTEEHVAKIKEKDPEVNMSVVINNNLASSELSLNIYSVEQLHRYDLLTEKLSYNNLKFLYVAATLNRRMSFYQNKTETRDAEDYSDNSQAIEDSPYMGCQTGVKIG